MIIPGPKPSKSSPGAARLLKPAAKLISTIVISVAVSSPVASAHAQRQTTATDTVGVLLVAHGAGPDWNSQVIEVAAQVDHSGPLAVSFLMGPGAAQTTFQTAVTQLEQRGAKVIVVVPILISSYSGHFQQIEYLAGRRQKLDDTMAHHLMMAGIRRPTAQVPLLLTPAIDDAAEIGQAIARRALELAADPAEQALFIIGHGPETALDYARWMANLRSIKGSVATATRFQNVLIDLLRDDAPTDVRGEAVLRIRELIELQYALTGKPVVVVPVMVATGTITRAKIPDDLKGLPISYNGTALLPDSAVARWIERRVQEALEPTSSQGKRK